MVRASGSRFGSWMTDAMIPSSDSRVRLQQPECVPYFCLLTNTPRCALCSHTDMELVVKATVSRLPGVIYITMVTLGCCLLEPLPSDEEALRSSVLLHSGEQLIAFICSTLEHVAKNRRLLFLIFLLSFTHGVHISKDYIYQYAKLL